MTPGFTKIDNDAVIARLPEIDGTALKVYLALESHTGHDRRCWPSQATIGKEVGLAARAVRYAVVRLVTLGLVSLEHCPGKPATYLLTPAQPCRPEDEGAAPPCRTPRHDDAGDPGTVMPHTPAPPCHRTRTKNKNQEQEPKNKGAGKPRPEDISIPDGLSGEEFAKAWSEWLTYRRERKLPLTPRALTKQLEFLKGIGTQGAIDSINVSIRSDWKGLFEPKANGRSKTLPTGPGQVHPDDGDRF